MKEFEKNINNILNDFPEVQPSAKRLNAMRKKLRDSSTNTSTRKPVGFLWILLPAIVLATLLGGGIMYEVLNKKQEQQNQQINNLQSQIAALSSDTVYIHRDIYHVDTVFTTVQTKEYITLSNQNNHPFTDNNSNIFTLSNYGIQSQKAPFLSLSTNPFGKNNFLLNSKESKQRITLNLEENAESLSKENQLSADLSNLQGLAYLPLNQIQQNHKTRFLYDELMARRSTTALPEKQKKSRKYINPLWSFIPTGAGVGFRVGNVTLAELGSGRHLNWHYGLTGEIYFGKNVRMTSGFEKINVDYVVTDELLFSNYPRITAENPLDQLHEIYVDLDYLQIPIGLKYVTRPDKKLRPFVSMSLVARQAKKQRFTYEYISMFQEYYATRTFKSSPFTLQSWRAGLGVEFDLGKGFQVNLEGLYSRDYDLNVFEYVELNHWGLNVGLQYRINKKR